MIVVPASVRLQNKIIYTQKCWKSVSISVIHKPIRPPEKPLTFFLVYMYLFYFKTSFCYNYLTRAKSSKSLLSLFLKNLIQQDLKLRGFWFLKTMHHEVGKNPKNPHKTEKPKTVNQKVVKQQTYSIYPTYLVGLESELSTHRNKEVDEKWGNKTSKKALHQSSSKIGSSNKARIKPRALSS